MIDESDGDEVEEETEEDLHFGVIDLGPGAELVRSVLTDRKLFV